MVPTQISCTFFPTGFFVAGFFWPPSNCICFVSSCSALFIVGFLVPGSSIWTTFLALVFFNSVFSLRRYFNQVGT